MTSEDQESVRGAWPRVIWAVLLSLFLPGLGQVYARAWRLGVILVAVNAGLEFVVRGFTWLARPTPLMVFLALPFLAASVAIRLLAAWHAGRRLRRHRDPLRPTWPRSTWVTAVWAVALATALDVLMPVKWRGFYIPSGSDVPTLLVGDAVLVDTRDPRQVPVAGDMVVFVSPRDPSIDFIKRVVGLPGDRIQLREGRLLINGQEARREPTGLIDDDSAGVRFKRKRYLEILPNGRQYQIAQVSEDGALNNTAVFIVPPDHCFVLGDNRDNSADSRMLNQIGYVPLRDLIGKAETIYWSRAFSRILTRVE